MQRTRSWKRRSQHNIYAALSEDEMTRHATYEIPSDNISGNISRAAHETLTAQPNDNIDNITIVVTLPTAAAGQLPKVIHLPNAAPSMATAPMIQSSMIPQASKAPPMQKTTSPKTPAPIATANNTTSRSVLAPQSHLLEIIQREPLNMAPAYSREI